MEEGVERGRKKIRDRYLDVNNTKDYFSADISTAQCCSLLFWNICSGQWTWVPSCCEVAGAVTLSTPGSPSWFLPSQYPEYVLTDLTSQLYYFRGILYLQNNKIVPFLKRSPWLSKGSSRIQYNSKKPPSILSVTGVHRHHVSGTENRKLRLSSFLTLAAPHEKVSLKTG